MSWKKINFKSMIKKSAKNLGSKVGMEEFAYQAKKKPLALGWNDISMTQKTINNLWLPWDTKNQ